MQKEYTDQIIKIINNISNIEKDNINKAAKIIYEAMNKKKLLHVFATGHSHMVAEEMFYRSGGLVLVNPILVPYLMQHEGAVSSTKYERVSGLAKIIYDGLNLQDDEPFLIVSNSGINNVPVEMAEIVKKNNRKLIVITSLSHSTNSVSRSSSGKKLYELADVVIDNHTPLGDTVVKTNYGNVGASSSIACSYIVQMIVLEIIRLYEENNQVPPIYQSANTPGGDEHNKKLMEEFQNRIKSLS